MAGCKYDIALDPGAEGTSHAYLLELVGFAKDVLDVGCATGYLAGALREQGCRVWGVEVDAEAARVAAEVCEQVVVGDLAHLDLDEALGGRRFDVVVLGDVLEHLLDPLPVLRASRGLLAPGGSVCISVPNVAHGAVRLSLLAGRWEYRPLGLLDDTHVRFFTREGLDRLLRAAGLAAADLRRTRAGLFETELELRPQDVDPELARRLAADDEATTYQFVLRGGARRRGVDGEPAARPPGVHAGGARGRALGAGRGAGATDGGGGPGRRRRPGARRGARAGRARRAARARGAGGGGGTGRGRAGGPPLARGGRGAAGDAHLPGGVAPALPVRVVAPRHVIPAACDRSGRAGVAR